MLDLPGLDQLGEGTDRFFDGNPWIDSMIVVQVHFVDAQPGQAFVDAAVDMSRVALGLGRTGCRVRKDAGFGRQDHFVAAVLEDPGEQPLVVPVAVDVGRIKQGDARVDGVVHGLQGLLFVGSAVGVAQPHSPEALGRDDQTMSKLDLRQCCAECAHGNYPLRRILRESALPPHWASCTRTIRKMMITNMTVESKRW